MKDPATDPGPSSSRVGADLSSEPTVRDCVFGRRIPFRNQRILQCCREGLKPVRHSAILSPHWQSVLYALLTPQTAIAQLGGL